MSEQDRECGCGKGAGCCQLIGKNGDGEGAGCGRRNESFSEKFEASIISVMRDGESKPETLFDLPQVLKVVQPGKKIEGKFLRFKILSEDLGIGVFITEERAQCDDGYIEVEGRAYAFKDSWGDVPVQVAQYSEKVRMKVIDENFFIFSLKEVERKKIKIFQYSNGNFFEGDVEIPD